MVIYNQCVTPLDATKLVKNFSKTKFSVSKAEQFSSDNNLSSVKVKKIYQEAFKNTVYNLSRTNCIICHEVEQEPLLASANIEEAQNSILKNDLIDYNDIENSGIVLTLKDEAHSCGDEDCYRYADEMILQIMELKNLIELGVSQESGSYIDTPSIDSTNTKASEESYIR